MKIEKQKVEALLKVAAVKVLALNKKVSELEKIASEYNRLKEAVELARKMYEKRLIDEYQIFDRIEELTKLGTEDFEKIKAKVELISKSIFDGLGIKEEANDIDRLIADALE